MKLRQLLLILALLISTCLLSFSLFAQPTSGLVGHFKFDGSVTNTGPGNVSATTHNVTYTTNSTGVSNKAIKFAGTTTSDVVITDNGNLDFTGDFSIAFGVNPTTLTVNQGFYDNGLNYGGCGVWYFLPDNTLRFNFKNGSLGAPGALTAGQWKAVCITRTGSTMRIYVNGVQVASGTEGTSSISYPNPPVLGQMYFAGGGGNYNPSSAALDQLRIYNRALSAAEVSQLVAYSLPLKMGDFTASKQPPAVQLNWETITEQNVSHFEIERSTDGINFTRIGSVNAQGNSADKQFYAYSDGQPFSGTNFYRLKLLDTDGDYSYSPVIALKDGNTVLSLQLFPNPVRDVLQVQILSHKKETVYITITDAGGKTLLLKTLQLNAGNNATSIPVEHLPKGTYYLLLDNKEGRQTKIFIHQ